MKHTIGAILLMLASVASWSQEDRGAQFDATVKRLLERSVQAPPYCTGCDSTGILVVRVEKRNGMLHTDFLFNSVKGAEVLRPASLNHESNSEKVGTIPEGHKVTVPVLLYFGMNDGNTAVPDAATKQRYQKMVADLKGKERVAGEVVVIGYAPVWRATSGK